MDMISRLPDGIISHILSFLPIKKAARTSVLSKRWRILFAFTPNLEFRDSNEDMQQSFMDFVDRVLAVSGNSPIKKFTLRCGKGFDQGHINRWICDMLNRGVLDLDLGIDANDGYSLPFEVFTCKTIVELKLSAFLIDVLPEDAFLPALKAFFLDSVLFYSLHVCVFETLISACPVLEELIIDDLNWDQWKWSRTVSSPTLQRLTVKRGDSHRFHGSDFGSITFDTPRLTYLDYKDFFPNDSYPNVNLNSLVEANLNLAVTVANNWDSRFPIITRNPTNLIKALGNVEKMNLLSPDCLEMFYFFPEATPVFENLLRLSITMVSGCRWRGLPFLLNKSPNLVTLIIEGPLQYIHSGWGSCYCECMSGYSCLSSCPVKVLKISIDEEYGYELFQMEHFLKILPCLELLEIRILGTCKEGLAEYLLMQPRASPNCKIKIKVK